MAHSERSIRQSADLGRTRATQLVPCVSDLLTIPHVCGLSTRPKLPFVQATRLTRLIKAPRAAVYAALLDPRSVRSWMVPDSMTSHIHSFDAREGGTFRISLTYNQPTTAGKSSVQTDTFHGRFVKLVQDTEIVQVVEFETNDPALRGEMVISYILTDTDGGTLVIGRHENLPPAVSPSDNELGWSMSMTKLARLVEAPPAQP